MQIIAEQLVTVTEVWMPHALACQMVSAIAAAGLRVEPASAAPGVMDLAARIQIAVADNRVLLEACNWESPVSLADALQAAKRELDQRDEIIFAEMERTKVAEARVKNLETDKLCMGKAREVLNLARGRLAAFGRLKAADIRELCGTLQRALDALQPFADWIAYHDGLANGTHNMPDAYKIGGDGPTLGQLRAAQAVLAHTGGKAEPGDGDGA